MLHRMAAYCSTAERCLYDIEKKIQQAGLSPEAANRIISRLVKEKFIDENRFARSFVNDKLRFNKWGKVKISYELKKRNIPVDILREAMEGIDDLEYNCLLLSILKEKKKTVKGKDDRDIFIKLLRFAVGRGFESKETISCLRQLLKGDGYADDME